MIGIPLSGIIGGPLSGALLGLDRTLGINGWQWLFLAEGVPAALLGFAVFRYLPDRPQEAHWLRAEEQSSLRTLLDSEAAGNSRQPRIGRSLAHPTIWLLGTLLFLVNIGFYGYVIWSPQIIKSLLGTDDWTVGIVSGAISVLMAAGMIWNGVHSDRTGERRLHVAVPLLIAAAGFVAAARFPAGPATCALALIPLGIGAIYGPVWSLPANFLSGDGAAAGMGLMGTVANFGGFFGPYLIGLLKDKSGDYGSSFQLLALLLVGAAALTWLVPLQSLKTTACAEK